jgi:hypothetical protein
MRKTVEQYFCDSCGKQKPFTHLNKINDIDICISCIAYIITEVLQNKLWVPCTQCVVCKGKGETKEFTHFDHEFEWKTCQVCRRFIEERVKT